MLYVAKAPVVKQLQRSCKKINHYKSRSYKKTDKKILRIDKELCTFAPPFNWDKQKREHIDIHLLSWLRGKEEHSYHEEFDPGSG